MAANDFFILPMFTVYKLSMAVKALRQRWKEFDISLGIGQDRAVQHF